MLFKGNSLGLALLAAIVSSAVALPAVDAPTLALREEDNAARAVSTTTNADLPVLNLQEDDTASTVVNPISDVATVDGAGEVSLVFWSSQYIDWKVSLIIPSGQCGTLRDYGRPAIGYWRPTKGWNCLGYSSMDCTGGWVNIPYVASGWNDARGYALWTLKCTKDQALSTRDESTDVVAPAVTAPGAAAADVEVSTLFKSAIDPNWFIGLSNPSGSCPTFDSNKHPAIGYWRPSKGWACRGYSSHDCTGGYIYFEHVEEPYWVDASNYALWSVNCTKKSMSISARDESTDLILAVDVTTADLEVSCRFKDVSVNYILSIANPSGQCASFRPSGKAAIGYWKPNKGWTCQAYANDNCSGGYYRFYYSDGPAWADASHVAIWSVMCIKA